MLTETIEDGIVIATLSDGKSNSITLDTLIQLDEIVKKVNTDDSLKGIVLTGNGRFFSSGFDLPMFLEFKDHPSLVDFFEKEEKILINYFTCKKPVVCAINGHCAAAGMILAMASDYRVAKFHPKIRMGMSEIKIGLPLSIAQGEVMRFGLDSDKMYRNIMYFGEMFDIKKAEELGIVDEVFESDEELKKRAKDIVTLWIDTPGQPFIPMKNSLKRGAVAKIREGLEDGLWKSTLRCFFREDVRATLEFVHASMEKKG
ncbi:MAG: enoyl-CoA hydratase/isomerase family protein [Proteobacteria bacterium]|nr:enoyl-CoA hydratase/isomerase family protein [Pseudomonadota bacterium]